MIALLLCPLLVTPHGQTFPVSGKGWSVNEAPLWAKAAWDKNSDLRTSGMRKNLEEMKWSRKPSDAEVQALCKKVFPPFVRKAMPNARMNLTLEEAFGAIAMCAYFPNTSKEYVANMNQLLQELPVFNSYDVARAGFVIWVNSGQRAGMRELGDRLLKRRPKDPLVRLWYVQLCRVTPGYESAFHDRMILYAEELYDEYPSRRDIFIDTCVAAYDVHVRKTWSPPSVKKCIYYYDLKIQDNATSEAVRANYKKFRDQIAAEAKRRGIKF